LATRLVGGDSGGDIESSQTNVREDKHDQIAPPVNGVGFMQRIERILGIDANTRPSASGWRMATGLAMPLAVVVAGIARATTSDGRETGQPAPAKETINQQFEAAGMEIKAAVASGELPEAEAWSAWNAARQEIISGAVEAGEISEEEATAFRHKIQKAELGERLGAAGERIKTAAENGEMTEEEAWAEWQATKEELITGAVDSGEITSADANAFHRELEKAEVGERLKAAVAKGQMTEEEAWARWAEINKEARSANGDKDPEDAASDSRVNPNPMGIPDDADMADDEWACYVRAFIARYHLTDDQQRQAWRFYQIYRDARDRAEKSASRLERDFGDQDDPQAQARRKSVRERAERDRKRLFERLKARLEKLPTRAQRRDAKEEQDKKP
jgi:polyhydroxyalkanoate synthesis regulator phasin